KAPEYFVSYFVPNYFDFGLNVPSEKDSDRDYLYLGAPAFAGLALLLMRKRFVDGGPAFAVLGISLLFAVNPFGAVGWIGERSEAMRQIISTYYFFAGVTAAVALLAALGLDYALSRTGKPAPPWLAAPIIALSLASSIRLIFMWCADKFAVGWQSGVDAIAATALF